MTAVNVTAGTAYWIAILGTQSGTPVFRDNAEGVCVSETSSQTTLTALPAAWDTGRVYSPGSCPISAYGLTSAPSGPSAIIGDQALENLIDNNPAGEAEAFPATANAGGTLVGLALYLDASSTASSVSVGIYADNNGHPGTLLGQGSTSQPVAGSWNQVSVASLTLTAGQHYWLAVLGTQSGTPQFHDRADGSCVSETSAQTNLTALPNTWTTGNTYTACPLSAYGLTAAPILQVSPSALTFTGTQGGANPPAVNLSATNGGGGVIGVSASTDASWLNVTPSSGVAPQVFQVSASLAGMNPGTYTGHVPITAAGVQGSPAVVNATLTISGTPGISGLSPSSGAVGAVVTISGTNFGSAQGGSTIAFNGTAATQPAGATPASPSPSPAEQLREASY